MSDSSAPVSRLSSAVTTGSRAEGDAPGDIIARYRRDGRGGAGLGYYLSQASPAPAFRDLGRQLVSTATEPAVIADMMAIARHRRWAIVIARGPAAFRREAWIAARMAGLEARGWRPTSRDLQLLEQRRLVAKEAPAREAAQADEQQRSLGPPRPEFGYGASAVLRSIETIVRRRVASVDSQDEILAKVAARIDGWRARGARFEQLLRHEAAIERPTGRQPQQR